MKILIKILFAFLVVLSLNGCGGKHSEDDGHGHGTEAKASEATGDEGHEEGSSTIATLTQEQIKAVNIRMGTIEKRNLTAFIKANGRLRVPNNNKANATSLYGGVVKTLKVQLGDYVKKGQVIATIENPQFLQLQEEYVALSSRITLSEQEMQRQKELNEGSAGALKNLQNATAELNTIRAREASLRKQIQLMGINPDKISSANIQSVLFVGSPISGTVSREFAKIGNYVDVSSPVVEIVDNGLLHLDMQVFERDLPNIKVGQTVNFTITNNPAASYTAKVFNIGSSFEDDSKTVAVHCLVTGEKNGLIDGMNISGMVSIEDVLATAVPSEAIVEADGKYYIFVHTDKEPESEHGHEEGEAHGSGEEPHEHGTDDKHDHLAENKDHGPNMNFEKVEVSKGVTELGYTAITPVGEIPDKSEVVVKGAFFINAKLSNTGGHEH
ncbi:efflux RND transporter periplasmic adaptor subunit [Olivibacter sp. 47]|jgi:RND family efflux transporter MFP subunit|uniref:efflux RND transporter periplasmic adaptor subunit n=1 Tax=Olivibacter sp. 47 TaxID=3056486 RepID=UPI0025A4143C|nr:efflux RND transporter periplasmic adaptor subunit [Olivibacter sp. 47]MDM8175930.1 efflux RND transporter periplasmic adaptor subunit [Olivibacter sp. 47]